jgi:hypothetical protein
MSIQGKVGALPKLEIGQGRRKYVITSTVVDSQFSAPQTPSTPPKEAKPSPATEPPAAETKAQKQGAVRRKKMKTNKFIDNKGALVAQQTTRSYTLEWNVAEGLSDYAYSTKQSASMIVNALIKKHILKQQ